LPESGGEVFGTIYISMEKAQELSEFYDCSLQKEICYLTVHEALHMIEHKKHTENSELRIQEKKETVMYQLGLPLSAGYALSNT
ncbi:MAG: rRNA maturation RNAse YbeY, partial [Ruminococcus sp.]|nr:rRNA maturation RNAse YbeY [Ruminococcus sp.]